MITVNIILRNTRVPTAAERLASWYGKVVHTDYPLAKGPRQDCGREYALQEMRDAEMNDYNEACSYEF